MCKQSFINCIYFLLIFLFVYTAVSKLSGMQAFQALLHAMPVISSHATWLAIFIPSAELITSLLLVVPVTHRIGLYCALLLLLLFSIFLAVMLLLSVKLPCSCGGVISSMSWQQHILFNLLFMGLCAIAIYYKRQSAS